jgi:hypothetical protein
MGLARWGSHSSQVKPGRAGVEKECHCRISLWWANSANILGTKEGVGLKAPSTVRDLHSEVRRDWKQLIGRKPAHTTAVKTGLGETPLKGGSPEE